MKKGLTFRQSLLVAVTLFGMFFGAGNLIFPVHLGQLAGRNLIPAISGFIITAVGLPVLAVAAIGNTHSEGLQALANKVGKRYSYVFTCLLYLTIGPFFAIPRCATTSFTTGILPALGSHVPETPALFIFSLIFFALVLFFSLRPANITVWIGKIINPVFLIFLGVLVIAALANPGAAAFSVEPDSAYVDHALFSAIIEGYGTMDAIAGLAFGIVVIDIIRRMGIHDDSEVSRQVLRSGVIAGILMAFIYALIILMGAQSRGLFEISENGGIALTQISGYYLGNAGRIVLAVTVTFACLKTSIGLVTSCSEAFLKMFPEKLSYHAWAVIFTIVSFCISNFGLSAIINYSLPVLMLLYPLSITLILMALFGKLFHHDRHVYISVTAFTALPALLDFMKALPGPLQTRLHLEHVIQTADRMLPWSGLNLGWVAPAITGLILGLIIRGLKNRAR